VFLTFPIVVVIARVGTLDALLSVHVLAVLALELVQHDHSGWERNGVIGLLLGLAFLVKGPVGVFLPLVMILAGRTATGRNVMPSVKTVMTTTLTTLAVIMPWGLVFVERIGGKSVLQLMRSETVDRAVAGTAHIEPWWYYLGVCLVAFLPWAGPLFLGTIRGLAHWHDDETPTGPFAAAAFAAGIVFFSLSKGKLPNYILPLAPLAALVVTFELGQELINPTKRRAGSSLIATTLVALSVALGVAAMSLEGTVQAVASLAAAAFGLAALVSLYGLLRSAPRIVYGSAALGSFVFLLTVVVLSPSVLATRGSAAGLVAAVPALRSSRPLVLVGGHLPSLTYYADRVPERVTGAELAERLDRGDSWSTTSTQPPCPPPRTRDFVRSPDRETCAFSSPSPPLLDVRGKPLLGSRHGVVQEGKDPQAPRGRSEVHDSRRTLGQVRQLQGDHLQERSRAERQRLPQVQLPFQDQRP
jgi:4-amino-4-deoxy-L-arabinose transferase